MYWLADVQGTSTENGKIQQQADKVEYSKPVSTKWVMHTIPLEIHEHGISRKLISKFSISICTLILEPFLIQHVSFHLPPFPCHLSHSAISLKKTITLNISWNLLWSWVLKTAEETNGRVQNIHVEKLSYPQTGYQNFFQVKRSPILTSMKMDGERNAAATW